MPPVQADKTGLTSVLQNLLENAVKYAPQGAPVVLTVERKDGKVRLQVADQGQGIPESEKKAVFEKFYRLGNADRPNTSGTGLGLYIVDQVVKAHGGTIVVTDNKPTGTIFTIEF
jgi:signal transduction histidine kinase